MKKKKVAGFVSHSTHNTIRGKTYLRISPLNLLSSINYSMSYCPSNFCINSYVLGWKRITLKTYIRSSWLSTSCHTWNNKIWLVEMLSTPLGKFAKLVLCFHTSSFYFFNVLIAWHMFCITLDRILACDNRI